jgi:hypothetical protein
MVFYTLNMATKAGLRPMPISVPARMVICFVRGIPVDHCIGLPGLQTIGAAVYDH